MPSGVVIKIDLKASDKNVAVLVLNAIAGLIAKGETSGSESHGSEFYCDDAWSEWSFTVEDGNRGS